MKICPNCNAECPDNVSFCASCGSDLSNVPAQGGKPEGAPAFCKFCGNKLEPGALFCPKCGNRLDGSAPVKQASLGQPQIIGETLGTLKSFVTKSPDAAVSRAAKSTGLSWTIFGGLSILAFMFALPTNIHQFLYNTAMSVFRKTMNAAGALGNIPGNYMSQVRSGVRQGIGQIHNWGLGLLWSLLIGAFVFFGLSFAIFGAIKLIHKKDVKLFQVFNMVSVAALPLTCVYLLNLLIGLIWVPLAMILTACAAILSLILLFNGFQKLAAFEKRPTLTFVGCVGVIVVIIGLIVSIVVSSKISGLAGAIAGGIGSGIGSGIGGLFN